MKNVILLMRDKKIVFVAKKENLNTLRMSVERQRQLPNTTQPRMRHFIFQTLSLAVQVFIYFLLQKDCLFVFSLFIQLPFVKGFQMRWPSLQQLTNIMVHR